MPDGATQHFVAHNNTWIVILSQQTVPHGVVSNKTEVEPSQFGYQLSFTHATILVVIACVLHDSEFNHNNAGNTNYVESEIHASSFHGASTITR